MGEMSFLINIIHINNVENKLSPSLLSIGFFPFSQITPLAFHGNLLKKKKKERKPLLLN